MADFSVTITVPDDKVTELVAALRWHWGPKSPGVEYTQAELRAKLKTSTENAIKDIFTRHKEWLRAEQVIDTAINIT